MIGESIALSGALSGESRAHTVIRELPVETGNISRNPCKVLETSFRSKSRREARELGNLDSPSAGQPNPSGYCYLSR